MKLLDWRSNSLDDVSSSDCYDLVLTRDKQELSFEINPNVRNDHI